MHTNTGRQTRQKLREPLQRAQRLYLFYFKCPKTVDTLGGELQRNSQGAVGLAYTKG